MLYPALEPFASGLLPLDQRHQLYWETSGKVDGFPVLYLHGGPGDACSPMCRQLFDPAFYRAVLFDQRGCGHSVPVAALTDNTTAHLLSDIETLRQFLGIDRWLVFGGSWGSTLALAYAEAYPERVCGLLLRGIFLGRPAEINWFLYGMRQFFPDAWQRFVEPIPPEERSDLLAAYYRRLCDSQADVSSAACLAWARYEASCVALQSKPEAIARAGHTLHALPLARIEAHYFINQLFLQPDQLLRNLGRISHLPVCIVQGRYDVICPPATAFELASLWPRAELCLLDAAGHSLWEPAILATLIDRLERFKRFCQRAS